MLFAAIAAGATVLTLAMPLLVRRHAVQAHEGGRLRAREDPAARARAAGARQQGVAAAIAESVHEAVVENFNLGKWVGQEAARIMLVQAGYRGQAPYVTYLFFRMVMPIAMLLVSLFYVFVVIKLDQPPLVKVGIGDRRRLFRHVEPEAVFEEQDSAAADFDQAAPFPMRSICC